MKIFQLIRQAFSSNPGKDDRVYPLSQCGYSGKIANYVRILPYGLSSVEPQGYFVLLFNSQGQEAVKYGIPSAMGNRKKNLKPGEVALFNSKTGVYVFIKEDGTVEINADTLIDGNLHITGNLQVDGNAQIGGTLAVSGPTTAGAVTCSSISINGIDFSTHRHSGVETGGGNTGGPL